VKQRNEEGKPFLDEGEQLISQQPQVQLSFQREQTEGRGTLYITSKAVIWLSDEDPEKGYSMDYYFIGLHAISRNLSTFPVPCIYCQLAVSEDEEQLQELFLAPSDEASLDNIYNAFSEGAVLNPDPVEEDEGEFYFNEDEVMGTTFEMPEIQEQLSEISKENKENEENEENEEENEMFEDS